MEAGIAAMVPGNRLTDVSHAIETGTRAAEERYDRKFGIVAGYGGHGIGRQMHMDPFLPNEGAPGRGPAPGAGFGAGHRTDAHARHHRRHVVLDDEWTVVTADGSRAAHWEHTVAVTDDGPRILTAERIDKSHARRLAARVHEPDRHRRSCNRRRLGHGRSGGRHDAGALRRARRGAVALCAAAHRGPRPRRGRRAGDAAARLAPPRGHRRRATARHGRGCSPWPET